MNPEDLLVHANFVNALARRLVTDEHCAADVSQDAWLAALQHPPESDGSVKGWLARVVRNCAGMLHRSEQRRRTRERTTPEPELPSSPDEIVASVEIRHRLVEKVLTLDEPYRSAILLRYYEGLTNREVAERLSVQASTVRVRVMRGLDRLREMLDAEHGGRRKAWMLALAPFAAVGKAEAAAASTAFVAGVLAMKTKLKIGIAAGLLLLVGAAYTVLEFLPEPPEVDSSTINSSLLTDGTSDVSKVDEDAIVENLAVEEEEATRLRLDPEGPFIAGRVVDKVTRAPVKGFHVWIPHTDRGEGGAEFKGLSRRVRDEEGRFRIPLPWRGEFIAMFFSSHYRSTRWIEVVAPGQDLVIEMESGRWVSGRVVDDETGEPVEGALVGPNPNYPNFSELLWPREGFEEFDVHTATGDDGRFALGGIREKEKVIFAMHPDYAEGQASISEEEIRIRLKRGCAIHGKVFGLQGEPIPGIMVILSGGDIRLERGVLTGTDGTYRSPPVQPGLVTVRAEAPPWRSAESYDFEKEAKLVEMGEHDLEVNFGLEGEYVNWSGILHDEKGRPVSKGHISIELKMAPYFAQFHFKDARRNRITTDESGRFEIRKLTPGRYRVEIDIPGKANRFEWGIVVLDSPGDVERDLHVKGCTVSGVLINGRTGAPLRDETARIKVRPAGANRESSDFYADDEGRFALFGLAPGFYSLAVLTRDFPNHYIEDFRVFGGGRDEDLTIVLPAGGKLRLLFSGFDPVEHKGIWIYFKLENKPVSIGAVTDFKEDGTQALTYDFIVGPGMLSLLFEDGRVIERSFEIRDSQVTELMIDAGDAVPCASRYTVEATVLHADGHPVEGQEVRLSASYMARKLDPDDRHISGWTDARGRATLSGLRPGVWDVSALMENGQELQYPELYLTLGSENPVPLRITRHGGIIRGELYDSITGLPLSDGELRRTLYLKDARSRQRCSTLRGRPGDPDFEFRHIAEGEYELRVDVQGYSTFLSKPFHLKEDGTADLGRLFVEPYGILELDVQDTGGRPVTSYRVEWLMPPVGEVESMFVAQGRYRFQGLPLGTVTLRVSADGYRPMETVAETGWKAGNKKRVILEKE